ncbi:hypothetical protein [Corynebacterium meridianum]|uniref:Uncharacterized protein n=1 Tax=Corynebacterium meridianum TaxID=2765363 RepID=A0A934M577_9CORY|nr:hypothetical protein [Corynebacterium meridianum]MBI8989826.1 hypothetical protein [Corynebacterium meridianum]MCK7677761.1 hypothetical protein [Corynebacterium meridianum]
MLAIVYRSRPHQTPEHALLVAVGVLAAAGTPAAATTVLAHPGEGEDDRSQLVLGDTPDDQWGVPVTVNGSDPVLRRVEGSNRPRTC